MKNKTIEEKLDESFDDIFEFICTQHDDLHELLIEYQEESTGKTIRISWRDREERINEEK